MAVRRICGLAGRAGLRGLRGRWDMVYGVEDGVWHSQTIQRCTYAHTYTWGSQQSIGGMRRYKLPNMYIDNTVP